MAAIDRIVLDKDGNSRDISVDEWKTIPLTEQVSLISAQKVKFFSGGAEISTREALAALKG